MKITTKELEKLLQIYQRRPFLRELENWDPAFHTGLIGNAVLAFIHLLFVSEFAKDDKVDFNDVAKFEQTFLTSFPREYRNDGSEAFVCWYGLIDFYDFLMTNGVLTEETYHQVMNLLLHKREFFMKNMNDPSQWSHAKRLVVEDEMRMIDDILAQEGLEPSWLEMEDKLLDIKAIEAAQLEQELKRDDNGKITSIDFTPLAMTATEYAAYQIRVDLVGFKPAIWRRVVVPVGITYEALHLIIQRLFEWENRHLYSFEVGKRRGDALLNIEDHIIDEQLAKKRRIDRDLKRHGQLAYIYDFGDNWVHRIQLERGISAAELSEMDLPRVPFCLQARAEAPVEDSRASVAFIPLDRGKINQRLGEL